MMRVATRRILCHSCEASAQKPIAPTHRYIQWAARVALILRADRSFKVVAERTGLHWETMRTIEKA